MMPTGWRASRATSRQAQGQAEVPLGRLVAVGDAGEADHLRLPLVAVEPLAEEVGRAVLDEDFRLEIEAGAQAEVFVAGAGVAVAAAVLATAIRVQAVAERDIGAVVLRDDAFGAVGDELGARAAVRVRRVGGCGVCGGFCSGFGGVWVVASLIG